MARTYYIPTYNIYILVADPRNPEDFALIHHGAYNNIEAAQRWLKSQSKNLKYVLTETKIIAENKGDKPS